MRHFAAPLQGARICFCCIPRAALRLPWAILVASLREANHSSLDVTCNASQAAQDDSHLLNELSTQGTRAEPE
jgi:hypothetical protein